MTEESPETAHSLLDPADWDTFRSEAMASFHKAKSLHKWNGGLPQKYFSKRIRKVFDSAG